MAFQACHCHWRQHLVLDRTQRRRQRSFPLHAQDNCPSWCVKSARAPQAGSLPRISTALTEIRFLLVLALEPVSWPHPGSPVKCDWLCNFFLKRSSVPLVAICDRFIPRPCSVWMWFDGGGGQVTAVGDSAVAELAFQSVSPFPQNSPLESCRISRKRPWPLLLRGLRASCTGQKNRPAAAARTPPVTQTILSWCLHSLQVSSRFCGKKAIQLLLLVFLGGGAGKCMHIWEVEQEGRRGAHRQGSLARGSWDQAIQSGPNPRATQPQSGFLQVTQTCACCFARTGPSNST